MPDPFLMTLSRGLVTTTKAAPALNGVDTSRTWFPWVREPFAGAWQRNREISVEDAFCHPTVFSCISLISSDFSKLRLKLTEERQNDVWVETESASFSPFLRKPNRYQTRNQFYECWANSKLGQGNTIVLKERDARGVVVAGYILDWRRVKPLVAPDGSVFYQLSADYLAGIGEQVMVPASEIIHDRWNCFYHPLVGLSPLYAAGLLVGAGQAILSNSGKFFENGARPGGVLTAPGTITDDTAKRLKEHWENNFTGTNAGRIAVLGDGLKYEAMAMTAEESQLIEQLKWTDEKICGIFRVPAYMVGVGAEPLNNNVEALREGYYSRCLQKLLEDAESCLDEGLGIGRGVTTSGKTYGTEFDLADLIRMDRSTQIRTLAEAVQGALLKPDEARAEMNRLPVKGGDAAYMQQQNYSLEALAKRDASDDPFGTAKPEPAAPAEPSEPANDDAPSALEAAKALVAIHKGFADVRW